MSRQGYWGTALRIGSLALSFGVNVLLARMLGARQFGEYSVALAWVLLASSIIQAGLPNLLIRESATREGQANPEKSAALLGFGLSTAFVVASVMMLVLYVLYQAEIIILSSPSLMYWGLPIILLASWTAVSEAITRGTGAVFVGQIEQVARPLVQLVVLLALVMQWLPRAPEFAMLALFAGSLAAALIAHFVRAQRVPLQNILAGFMQHRKKLRNLGVLSGIGWSGAVSIQAGVILLGIFDSDLNVANYRLALQVSALSSTGVAIAYATQLPAINAALVAGERATAQTLLVKSSRLCLGIGLIPTLPTLLFGEQFLTAVFGEEYRGIWLLTLILMVGQLGHAATGVVAGVLYAARSEASVLGFQVLFLSLRVFASVLLIPIWGPEGVALATALEVIVFHLVLVVLARRRVGVYSLPFFWRLKARA